MNDDRIEIRVSGSDYISEVMKSLPDELQGAARRAVNKTARQIRQRARKGIASRLGIKPGLLDRHKRIASQGATTKKPSAFVWAGGNPLPAIYFSVTPSDDEFLARMTRTWAGGTHEGHWGIFQRVGKSRLPIEEVKWSIDAEVDAEMAAQEPIAAELLMENFEAELGNA